MEKKTTRNALKKLDNLAEELGTSDARVNECLVVLLSDDEDTNPHFHWKAESRTNPYAKGFIDDLGFLVDSWGSRVHQQPQRTPRPAGDNHHAEEKSTPRADQQEVMEMLREAKSKFEK